MDILIIDDEKSIRDNTALALEAEGHYVEGVDSGTVGMMRLREEAFDLVFLDIRIGDENGLDYLPQIRKKFPHVVVIVFTAHASVDTAVQAIQAGAMDYLEKPFTPEHLRGLLVRAEKHRQLQDRIEELEVEVSNSSPPPRFESDDTKMRDAYEILFRAAPTAASLLILGESGTGKSMVAKAIHDRSHLKNKPFVTISCPSLSKDLLESELFGHVKGAFTGALRDKWGKVHAANGGTLFLDEIGELPLDIQPKLLRLLQEREYERVGETKTRTADVRVIAATNRDLKDEVAEGNFREDLYYRLNVIGVEMPPLRSRPVDLIKFAEEYQRFFTKTTGRAKKGFSSDAMAALSAHSWPGNLRELRNSIERAVILANDNIIVAGDLPTPAASADTFRPTTTATPGEPAMAGEGDGDGGSFLLPGGDVSIEELEAEHIRRVLGRADTLQDAAEVLGIDQATLYRKRKKLGLK